MRIRLALTLDLHRDPPPTPDDEHTPPAPDVDEKASVDLTRRTTPDQQLGFQPRDVEA